MTEYFTFKDVEHRPLRIYNRCVTFFNILEDAGKAAAEEYVKEFTDDERVEMYLMTTLVKKHGPRQVKVWVTEGATFEDYPTEDDMLKKVLNG